MKIGVFSPYGTFSQESGLIYLLANYLKSSGTNTFQLRCNGFFPVCDRDSESGWKRTMLSCPSCARDQRSFAEWANIDSTELSMYLSPREVEQSYRFIADAKVAELLTLQYGPLSLFDACQQSFRTRFGYDTADIKNKAHVQYLQKAELGALRMCLATRRFFNNVEPTCILLAGGRDYLSQAFSAASQLSSRSVALFQWRIEERSVRIYHPWDKRVLSCELVLPNLDSIRSDCSTWLPEVVQILKEILEFLGISPEAEQVVNDNQAVGI